MKRTRRNKAARKPDAILSSDWHIRPDVPKARTDDFWAAAKGKIQFILDLGNKHGCPILLAGDLGHRPGVRNWPFWLLHWAVATLYSANIIAIPGQHDLPNHQIDLIDESGMGIISQAGAIDVALTPRLVNNTFGLFPFYFGNEIDEIEYDLTGGPNVAMSHQMTIEDRKLWPDQKAPTTGHDLLKKFPQYNLILTGDNHNAFTAEYEGRLLVNPGSLCRTAADQMQHRPRVYLWYADTNTIEVVYLPIEQDVLSREHIDRAKHQDERFGAYVRQNKKTEQQGELSLSFEANMEMYFSGTRVRKPVKAKVIKAMV